MSLLSCHQLACGYDDRVVVSGVTLSLEPRTSITLLGPNGSGKSTLLKTLVRMLPVISGELKLGEDELGGLSDQEVARRIAYVPQEELHAFDFLVRDVVTMGRLPYSQGLFDTDSDRKRAEEAMKETDCFHLAARLSSTLGS